MFFALLFIHAANAQEIIRLPVAQYDQSSESKIWKGVGRDQIPEPLLKTVEMTYPSQANAAPFQQVFLQNERVVVCYQSCDQPQPVEQKKDGRLTQLIPAKKKTDAFLRIANAYYWSNALFDRMQTLGYLPKRRLTLFIDREVKDSKSQMDLSNNAHFDDQEYSLSFLPSRSSMAAQSQLKISPAPSSHDPSIILHETMHSVFGDVAPLSFNAEALGVNEGAADYFALSLLGADSMGRFMLRGHALRNATATAIQYASRLEQHDLGEFILQALWKLRTLYITQKADPVECDRLVFKAIESFGKNPYATAKTLFLEIHRLASGLKNTELAAQIEALEDGITYSTPKPETYDQPVLKASQGQTLVRLIHQSTFKEKTESVFIESYGSLVDLSAQQFKTLMRRSSGDQSHFGNWFWIQEDQRGNIIAADEIQKDSAIRPILSVSDTSISSLSAVMHEWPIAKDTGLKATELYLLQLFSLRNGGSVYAGNTIEKPTTETIHVNGTDYPVFKNTRYLRKSEDGFLLEKLGRSLGMDEAKSAMRMVKSISYFVVKKPPEALIAQASKLTYDGEEHHAIGYEIEYGSGLIDRVMLQEIRN